MKDIKSAGTKPFQRKLAALEALRGSAYYRKVLKSMKRYVQFYVQQERILDISRNKAMLFDVLNFDRLSIIDKSAEADHVLAWLAQTKKLFPMVADISLTPRQSKVYCLGLVPEV